MSFYPQPFKYQCGPFALKYALVMLGLFVNEKEIAKKAGSTWWYGTDEIGLAKAAKHFKCRMKYFKGKTKLDGVNILKKHLRAGYPCILSVDNWEHWITVIYYQKKKFIVVDSAVDNVIIISSVTKLLKRWKYIDNDSGNISYDGYALIPKFRTYTKAKFNLEKAKFLMRKNNKQLAENWDYYFNDLITICRPRVTQAYYIISFKEFLRRNGKLIVNQVADWHGSPTYAELNKILKQMTFVADVYDLVIHTHEEKKAIIDLSSILMMYACGKYGMTKIYQ
ncbi:MAG TPA: hypothetical protein ENI57_03735 [Ignavibacteria bacterium]|nr:hypothetical protein [Ignavibacteria bacterium]